MAVWSRVGWTRCQPCLYGFRQYTGKLSKMIKCIWEVCNCLELTLKISNCFRFVQNILFSTKYRLEHLEQFTQFHLQNHIPCFKLQLDKQTIKNKFCFWLVPTLVLVCQPCLKHVMGLSPAMWRCCSYFMILLVKNNAELKICQ